MDISLVAGMVSTTLFAFSMLPMLLKAARTHDLESYSLTNLATINLANLVHSVYVFAMPLGPIWILHSFYLVASALMLVWWLRYSHERHGSRAAAPVAGTPDVDAIATGQETVTWARRPITAQQAA